MAAKGAEALKTTVDQFTAAGNQAFKDSIEKSLSALGEVNGHSKKNVEAVVASVTAPPPRALKPSAPRRWPIRRRPWKTR